MRGVMAEVRMHRRPGLPMNSKSLQPTNMKNGIRTSEEWRVYYEQNAAALMEIPWHLGAELTPQEIEEIGHSLAEFQVGEGSEGRHLIAYARQYADRSGDSCYPDAIRLFIAEEQRHARDLGRFLKLNGIPLLKSTFGDRVFRFLRNIVGGLEVSVAVLVTAEIIAKVYYAVLREATGSIILKRLCDQILRDEESHVDFQSQQLEKLRSHRGAVARKATLWAQEILFLGTVLVVWMLHRKVMAKARWSMEDWWVTCWKEFHQTFSAEMAESLESIPS